MILDHADKVTRYAFPFADRIRECLAEPYSFLQPVDEIVLVPGELRVRPARLVTRLPESGKFESHRCFADLQYVLEGRELMQVAEPATLVADGDYDEGADCQFFTASSYSSLLVPAGCFAFFYPGEVHRPCCQAGRSPEPVAKLVFKIRIIGN